MRKWNETASADKIQEVVKALAANGIEATVVENSTEAVKTVLGLVPEGSEVFTSSSVTVDSIGLAKILNESGKFDSVKTKLFAMDPSRQGREMRKLGAAPDVVVGSAHALTTTGSIVVASLTGSQLPAYTYGAGKVIFVVGAQKIVGSLDEAVKRIEEYIVPLESERARKAYGLPEGFYSFPSKVLFINREVQPGRIKVVIVKEALGF